MKRFIENFKKYNPYALYAAKAELKAEVANSYLTWLWWILDPLFFMLIYTFIVQIVFATSVPKLPVFVMSGLVIWNFFNKNIMTSVKIISNNKAIITQKYIPKYILVIQKIYVNFIKFIISLLLLSILALFYKVSISFTLLYAVLLLLLLLLLSFSLSTILAHFGVFIEDSANIIQILLRLLFYLSGIFYSIEERLSDTLCFVMMRINPVAYIIEGFRDVFMYQKPIDLTLYGYWFIIISILSMLSIRLIHKYENSYAKVM